MLLSRTKGPPDQSQPLDRNIRLLAPAGVDVDEAKLAVLELPRRLLCIVAHHLAASRGEGQRGSQPGPTGKSARADGEVSQGRRGSQRHVTPHQNMLCRWG
eukprot:605212-Prorocentrum_minimum.AAC.1